MTNSIIQGVVHEIGELAKDTGKAVVETPTNFLGEMIGAPNMVHMTPEELAEKKKKEEERKQKQIALHKRTLQAAQNAQQHQIQEVQMKKQQELRGTNEQKKPFLGGLLQRQNQTKQPGSAFAVKKKRSAPLTGVEVAKKPTQ